MTKKVPVPIDETLADAWARLVRDLPEMADDPVRQTAFIIGASIALSLTYHFGFVDIRKEVAAFLGERSDD
jgi:hypothetical protein